MNNIYLGDNLPILSEMEESTVDLIYIDPPFNTGKRQSRTRIKTTQDPIKGDRKGFGGKLYLTKQVGKSGFDDDFDDYLNFLKPRLIEAYRLLKPKGSCFLHIDYREVHYCKI